MSGDLSYFKSLIDFDNYELVITYSVKELDFLISHIVYEYLLVYPRGRALTWD